MHCPNCQSTKLQKKGKRAGKQRYRCSNCGANFTEGATYTPAKRLPLLNNIKCPECGESHVIRDGKTADGTQRYQCQSCGLNFNHKTKGGHGKRILWTCPYCGGSLRYSGYSKSGYRSYLCKECKKSCTADAEGKPIKKEEPFSLTNESVKCPHCNSTNLKKAGFNKLGNQRYVCNSCERSFNKHSIKRQNIEEAVNLMLQGRNLQKISKSSGYSSERLRKIMSPYYKMETINENQKKDIIKYGFYLKVPVDYMAEYIKCSEHKCREVLRRYREKIKSTTHDAT